MKPNKLFIVTLLAACLGFAACDDNEGYTPAQVADGPTVFFHKDNATKVNVKEGSNVFTIQVNRSEAAGPAKHNLKIEAEEGVLNLIDIPAVAVFDADATSATLSCTTNITGMEYDKEYVVTISVEDKVATPYGTSSLVLTVTRPAPWKSLGKATFVDGIITSIFSGVAEDPYEVEIQENELVPGLYRLVNPYTKAYPLYPSESIKFDDTKDYYLEIHAEDPEAVWFGETDLGLDMGYGMISAISIADYYVQEGNDPALVKELGYYGTLKDGEITFPVQGLLYTMPGHPKGEAWYYANTNGQFSILLPGYVKGDYSASLEYAGIFTAKDGKVYASAMLSLGKDATDVKAIVMPADADAAAVADAIAAGELEAVKVEKGRIEVSFDAEELGGNNFQIIAVVMSDGEVKTVAAASFEYYGGGKSPWQSLGTGYYTDDVIAPLVKVQPLTYQVEILENEDNPGIYRVMNPYSNSVYPLAEDDAAPEGLFIEVNAQDPEGVYIQYQSLGFDWGVGEFGFCTVGANFLAQGISFDLVKNYGYLGSVVEGTITFPVIDNEGTNMQGYVYADGELFNYAGMNGKIEIVLPEANAFAHNMAKAKANSTKREAIKKSFSGIKASRKRAIFLNRAVEVYATPNF